MHMKYVFFSFRIMYKKKIMIPEAVNRGRPKVIRTKGQTMIYKTLHRKLTIEQHKPMFVSNK